VPGSDPGFSPRPGDDWAKCRQSITGTDSTTGFAWPPSFIGGDKSFELRSGNRADGSGTNPTPATIADYMFNQIRAGEGRNGGRGLYMQIHQNGCCGTNPQTSGATYDAYLLSPRPKYSSST
jgi:hypothetical protein